MTNFGGAQELEKMFCIDSHLQLGSFKWCFYLDLFETYSPTCSLALVKDSTDMICVDRCDRISM